MYALTINGTNVMIYLLKILVNKIVIVLTTTNKFQVIQL